MLFLIIYGNVQINAVSALLIRCRGGMRESLYVKDDDYRMSFLYGNFITLTNLTDNDLDRIRRLHLSPLYVSVHTTNGTLRKQMMKNPRAGDICAMLEKLADCGIQMNTLDRALSRGQ